MKLDVLTFLTIVALTHYIFKYTKQVLNLSTSDTLLLLFAILYHLMYWSSSLFFEWMDNAKEGMLARIKKKYKMKLGNEKDEPFIKFVPTCLLNQFIQLLMFSYILRNGVNFSEDLNFGHTLLWFLVNYFIYDFVFFFGHLAMHKIPLLIQMHKRHHQSMYDLTSQY